MTDATDRFRRAMEIFDAVCDLPAGKRGELLAQMCGDDTDLRREVDSLLQADSAEHQLVEAAEDGRSLEMLVDGFDTDNSCASNIPEEIGGYRIVREIGRGGMGIIYEAEQESPHRKVALKVLRPGSIDRELLRRFQQEAHVLGQLQHSGIAQIFEAGIADTPLGRQPFFVMELIDGETLDRHAENNALNVPQRLELLARVCDGVQHSHQKGIIHRDLKPSNVLVVFRKNDTTTVAPRTSTGRTSITDGIGQPKVLDFGIARVTDSDMQTVTMQTEVGQLVGTLVYMSPEQVEGNSDDIDTRCDVYALGVILYELLAGKRPHDLAGLPVTEAARRIREEDPPRLGTIDRRLRGDVETIVAKAIEKDRERRYASAAEFAADLRRFLGDQPIDARPASTSYQFSKFARRNKGLVAGIAVAIVAMAAGLVGTTYSAIQASQERDAKQTALEVSDAVTEFLSDMLAAASPKKQGKGVSVREVMDNAALEVGDRFAEMPLVEAKIRLTIGRTYIALGEYSKAEQQLRPAIDLCAQVRGGEEGQSLEARTALAEVYHFRGKRDLAAQAFESVLTECRTLLEPNDPQLISAIGNVAFIRMQQGRSSEAERLFQEAIVLQRKFLDADDPDAIDLKANLAMLYTRMGRGKDAEPFYTEVIERSQRVRGPDHPQTLLAVANLASLYTRQGQDERAVPLFEHALEAQRRVLGRGHRQTLITLNNLALVLRTSGRLTDAETILKEGVVDAQHVYADDEPTMLLLRISLGDLLFFSGKLDEAEAALRPALDAGTSTLDDSAKYPVIATDLLARVYLAQSEFALAVSLAQSAVAAAERSDWATPANKVKYSKLLARAYAESGRFEDGERLLIDLDNTVDSSLRSGVVDSLADLYESWGKPQKAAKWRAEVETAESP